MSPSKEKKFKEELDNRLQAHCSRESGFARLIWLTDQEVEYINRWADFVDLRKIKAAELVDNDFFCIVRVCAYRMEAEAVQVALSSDIRAIISELLFIIDVINKDYLVDRSDNLRQVVGKLKEALDRFDPGPT